MARTKMKIGGSPARARTHALEKMLEDRREALAYEVQGRIRDARTDGTGARQGLDEVESTEAGIQYDIEFALIQMKAEMLNRIDTALRRLEEGAYGDCFECGGQIAEARLRAVPFAVRCKGCEEANETSERQARVLAQRRGAAAIALDLE